MSRSIRLFTFAAPSRFFALSGFLLPWLWLAAIGFALAGLYMGFFVAPTDATQGDSYRIIFVHVPAAWMSMVLYLVMAGWAVFGWAANARLASMVARALARANRSLMRGYRRSLAWCLRHQPVVLLVLAGVVGLNVYLYTAIDKGFMPEQDTGRISGFIRADQATSYQAMEQRLQRFLAIVQADPAVLDAYLGTGETS